MTKVKGLPPTRLVRAVRIFKWGIALVVVCGCGGLALMIAFLSIGTVEPVPNPTLLLTAEYLYEHPQPTLEYLRFNPHAAEKGDHVCYEDRYVTGGDMPAVVSPRLSDFSEWEPCATTATPIRYEHL
jgi:hypothetical protein